MYMYMYMYVYIYIYVQVHEVLTNRHCTAPGPYTSIIDSTDLHQKTVGFTVCS